MNLRYDMILANKCGITDHPQLEMKNLGITYQIPTPQSMGDQWWFWNCKNIPEELPKYLENLDLDSMDCIGYGLSREEAIIIRDYEAKNEN